MSVEAVKGSPREVFAAFLRLGLTAFGGPIAHLGYFHRAFVERRRWLDEASYGDIVAVCQFLPGPASSQTGILIGLARGGYAGAVAAWVGFTSPSRWRPGPSATGGWTRPRDSTVSDPSCSAAATWCCRSCSMRWSIQAGSIRTPSWRATAPPRPCPVRSSPSPPTLAR